MAFIDALTSTRALCTRSQLSVGILERQVQLCDELEASFDRGGSAEIPTEIPTEIQCQWEYILDFKHVQEANEG